MSNIFLETTGTKETKETTTKLWYQLLAVASVISVVSSNIFLGDERDERDNNETLVSTSLCCLSIDDNTKETTTKL